MQNVRCVFFKVFLVFVLYFYFCVVNAGQNLSCQEEYIHLLSSRKYLDPEEIISKGKLLLKGKCQSGGEYEFYLGSLYTLRENKITAKELFEKVIKENRDYFFIRESERMLVVFDLAEKQFDVAKRKSVQVMKKYPKWYGGYVLFGISIISLEDDYLKAKKYFDESIKLEETWEGRCWQAIVAYNQFKDYKQAFELYDRALQLDMAAILENTGTAVGIASAMNIGEWDAARWMLNTQKAANKAIEDCSYYKELRARMDEHDREQ